MTLQSHVAGLLIVEDETEIRTLLAEVFRLEHYEVFQAADGLEALRLFEENMEKIDLMITDLGLPNLGGVELIEKTRELKPELKIIGSSGYGRANIREEVLNAGGDEFVPKPYLTKMIVRMANQLLTGEKE